MTQGKTIAGALAGLLSSRKAIVVIVAIGTVAALGFTHNVDGDRVLEFVKWVLMVWLGAQAYEDAKIKSASFFVPTDKEVSIVEAGASETDSKSASEDLANES